MSTRITSLPVDEILTMSEPSAPSDLPASSDLPAASALPASSALPAASALPVEIGGRKGPEPTRYGDWEKNGRCIDF